jgi:hypothetical protein
MTLLSEPTSGARHRAPESDAEIRIAAPGDLSRTGRHAEPERAREPFDPGGDEDPVDRLGFSAGTA